MERTHPTATTAPYLHSHGLLSYIDDWEEDDLPPLPSPLDIPDDIYPSLRRNETSEDNLVLASHQERIWFTPRNPSSWDLFAPYHDVDEVGKDDSGAEDEQDGGDLFAVDNSANNVLGRHLFSRFSEFGLHEDHQRLDALENDDDDDDDDTVLLESGINLPFYTTTAKRKRLSSRRSRDTCQDAAKVVLETNEDDMDNNSVHDPNPGLGTALPSYFPSVVISLDSDDDDISNLTAANLSSSPTSCVHNPIFPSSPNMEHDGDEPMYDPDDDEYQGQAFMTYSPPPVLPTPSPSNDSPPTLRALSPAPSGPPPKSHTRDVRKRGSYSTARTDRDGKKTATKKTKEANPNPPKSFTDPAMPDYSAMTLPELKVAVKKYGFRATSRNVMVAQLGQVWRTLHPTSSGPDAGMSSRLVREEAMDRTGPAEGPKGSKRGKREAERTSDDAMGGGDVAGKIVIKRGDVQGSHTPDGADDFVEDDRLDEGEWDDEDGWEDDEDEDDEDSSSSISSADSADPSPTDLSPADLSPTDPYDSSYSDSYSRHINWPSILPLPSDTSPNALHMHEVARQADAGEWDPLRVARWVVRERLAEFVREDEVVYDMVLQYKPIDVDKLYIELCAKYGPRFCTKYQLQKFLDKEGIVFVGAEEWHGPKARRKKRAKE